MKKALFIDRDGTLIVEPPVDFQVDTLEKLEFIPGVFRNLYQISKKLDYELVIVSNQDGLGTAGYPEENFRQVQDKMLKAFENEGIRFNDILIDKSFEADNAPTRKPKTALLSKYMTGDYDLQQSWVIGDRPTDVELAKNLGTKSVFFNPTHQSMPVIEAHVDNINHFMAGSWDEIYSLVALGIRSSKVLRNTAETSITVELNCDGSGKCEVETGLGFFDHMISQLARHSGCDLKVKTNGDLHVDEHHTIEDTGLAIGEAFYLALGNKRGMERYGFALPMDDCSAQVLIDFSGRPWLVWDAEFKREKIGEMPTEMFMHFFKSFSDAARCNLNIKATGSNEHHKIEAIFKALARAIKMAIRRDAFDATLPSTKGIL
ncbi:MAG: bifunctional histidinol-phosphatase/imidazoleglycerol-phosphate dehydratase HisB [Bacteroidales bacterium]|nr:bifunctional histidinol-phosphatase/imidazoleglycerol-phosphate dehydratase HisB [Bacteroidales bacterium]